MHRLSAFFLLFCIFFATVHSSTQGVVKVLKCPCTFSVSRQVRSITDKEPFDVIVSPVFSEKKKTPPVSDNELFEKLSARNLRVSDAVLTQSDRHIFREMTISDEGLFRVQIRHHSARNAEDSPSYELKLHVSARQLLCPVILEPDPPLMLDPIRRMPSAAVLSETVRMNATQDPRIVGGLFISPTLLPYLVAVQTSDGRCSGTLLSARWIMTAAHCGVSVGDEILVSTRSAFNGRFTTVSRVFTHPSYNTVTGLERNFFDISVAELAVDITGCCNPRPLFMPINFNRRLPRSGAFVRAAGFGVTSDDGSVPEPELGLLRQVDIPVVNINRCREAYGTISSESQQVCAGYFQSGGCDSCFGDSGGPLVQYAGSTPVLMGLTSFGIGCAQEGFPGVYVNPAGHRQWLESTPAIFTANRNRITQVRRRCPRGSFLPFVEDETSNCTPCPDDENSTGGPVRECRPCPNNLLRDTRRGDRCSCRALAGRGLRNGRCEECRAGFASRVGQQRCIRCRSNTFAADPGMTTCLPCPGAPRGARECPGA